MNLEITSINNKKSNDILSSNQNNKLMNLDKQKPGYLYTSEESKRHLNDFNSINNISTLKNKKLNLTIHTNESLDLKKINLSRIIKGKKNNSRLKKPVRSQLFSLKYYLLYSKPGVGKQNLQNIYEDLDNIQKNIDTYEKKEEENKVNICENNNINNNDIDEHKMVVNIPDFSDENKNLSGALSLCRHYEKYNREFLKIKNLFGTKINLFEKKEIIKKYIINKELNNKTLENFSHKKKKLRLFFPKIQNEKNNINRSNKRTNSFNYKVKMNNVILRNINKNFINLNKNSAIPNLLNKKKSNTVKFKVIKSKNNINKTFENIRSKNMQILSNNN